MSLVSRDNSVVNHDSPLLRRDNTLGILNQTTIECREQIGNIVNELKDANVSNNKDLSSNLKKRLSIYKNDLDTRIAISDQIGRTRNRDIPFFHYFKKNQKCAHKSNSAIKDDRLHCVSLNSGKPFRKDYHNALNQVPLKSSGLIEEYQPGIIKRTVRKIFEKL